MISVAGCQSSKDIYDYTDITKPRFASGNFHRKIASSNEDITIILYNIKFSEKIDEAINIFKNNIGLRDAEFIFLQEMDLEGVQKISKALDYNYVYYPTSRHPFHGNDFGNAILSKWKFINDEKIIFGYSKYVKRQRVAIKATVGFGDKVIELYNVHMHVKITAKERSKRLQRLIDKSKMGSNYCIIGGDFNTFWTNERNVVRNKFLKSGFKLANEDVGWTFKHWIFLNKKYFLDHIFSRGFQLIDSGKVEDQSASDHVPVWSKLSF